MQLLIIRHGIAEDAGPDQADAERRLTSEGVTRTTLAAAGLARVADRPQALLTSPKIRATQTAAIIGDALDLTPTTLPVLADGDAPRVREALRQRDETALAIVGHEPTLSRLIELLCAGGPSPCFVAMKKAGAAQLDAPLRRDEPAGAASLHWLIPPRVLRQLGDPR